MQEEEAFLLPSQRKHLEKLRMKEAQQYFMQQNQQLQMD